MRDRIALGVLTATFPPDMVDRAIEQTGRKEQRYRLLPARLVVYYTLAMTLFREAGYEEVMRSLTESLAWASGDDLGSLAMPSSVAITKARTRLGPGPLEALFRAGCTPLATPESPKAFWRGLRLVSLDGSTLDTPDNPETAAAFGKPGGGRGETAFPQLRVVAIAECATHAMFAAALGPYAGADNGEVSLAKTLTSSLSPGMLVLADRGFCSHPLFSQMAASGAELCWRAKSNAVLPVLSRHPDGSYASELVASDDKAARARVTPVRVVEYRLEDPGRPGTEELTYRLVTTLRDPSTAPAAELAELYATRWEIETSFDELKTHQAGPRVVLRSKTPEGIYQEAWGMLCVHYAIRALMATAAGHGDVAPDRVSFTRALRAARRSLGRSADAAAAPLAHAIAEILHELLPQRRLRSNPRVVRRKMSKFSVRRAEHAAGCWPQPTRTTRQAVRIIGEVASQP